MTHELPPATVLQHAASFPGPHLAMIIESVAAGNTAARLWQFPQPVGEPVLLLWEQGNNGLYLSHLPDGASAQRDLALLLNTTFRAEARARGLRRFKLRSLAPAQPAALHALFPSAVLKEYHTHFYAFEGQEIILPPEPQIAGLRFAFIDRKLLADERIAHRDHILEEISGMWPTEEQFYTHGFGVAALIDNAVICWCTAEFVGPARCGIGIATAPAYERRGVATATAARFAQHVRAHGLTPYWECGATNLPSVRVAQKVGFTLLAEETYWIGTSTP